MKTLNLKIAAVSLLILLYGCTASITGYKASIKNTTKFHWNKNFGDTAGKSSQQETMVHPSGSGEIPVAILYQGDTLYSEQYDDQLLMIILDEVRSPSLWTPVYKSGNFFASGKGYYKQGIDGVSQPGSAQQPFLIRGEFTSTGRISLFGLCSQSMARQKVRSQIIEGILSQVRTYLKSL